MQWSFCWFCHAPAQFTYKDGVFSQGLSPSRTTSVFADGGRRGLPGDDISVIRLSLSATNN